MRVLASILVLIAVCSVVAIASLPLPCHPETKTSQTHTQNQPAYKNCPSTISSIFIPIGNFIHTYKDEITSVATAFLAFITGGLVYVAWLQIRTSKAQLRAHIIVDGLGVKPFKAGGSAADYFIKNVGQMPATKVEWWIKAEFSEDGRRMNFPIEWTDTYGQFVIAPGVKMIRKWEFDSTQSEITNFLTKKWVLYIWGEVQYLDGFSRKRWTKFCHRYGLGLKVVVPLEGDGSEIPAHRMKYHQYGNKTDDA
jgi:hypothetical protein